MICCERVSATLDGTTWVTVKKFTGPGIITEVWLKIPADIGTGTNVIVGIFNGSYLTDADERYNSGNLAENGDHDLNWETVSGTDIPLRRLMINDDQLMMKADGAATKDVAFVIYWIE